MSLIADEVAKRRTFAIISHPDAGKTTITEKVLLFGNAILQAGTIKGKKSGQHAKSDWMDMEKERGISITTSVMQFPYANKLIKKEEAKAPPSGPSEIDLLIEIRDSLKK